MAISDIAARTNTRSLWRTCLVCDALDNLPAQEAASLRSLLADPGWRYTELSEAIAQDEDYPLSLPPDTLSRHARGQCSAREKLRGVSA